MIDDYLNPFGKHRNDQKDKVNLKILPPSSTMGNGLIQVEENDTYDDSSNLKSNTRYSSASNVSSSQTDSDYVPFYKRGETANNFEYVKHYKTMYEKELIQASQLDQMSFVSCKDEDISVVGSGVSQLESVSTMNISIRERRNLMNRAEKLAQINDQWRDESVCGENIDMCMENVGSMYKHASQIRDVDFEKNKMERLEELCKSYTFREQYDPRLPVTAKRENIVGFIRMYNFCIIQGGTGCGKTTQVPQYILDDHMQSKKYCNIIVTQPRRIAAVSVSRRVCQERDWTFGSLCGYQIGLDKTTTCEDTRITYVTTGILLQKLISSDAEETFNKTYTHIILDEVHERDLDTDFVLLVIKLKSYRNLRAKVILMSATIDSDMFAKYFSPNLSIGLNSTLNTKGAPILKIENNPYNVQDFYWEDLVENNSFIAQILASSFYSNMSTLKPNEQSIYNLNNYYKRKGDRDSTTNTYNSLSNRFTNFKEFRQRIKEVEFIQEEPVMHDETMLMALNLLKYFDEIEIKAIKEAQKAEEDDENEFKNDSNNNNNNNNNGSKKPTKKKLRIINGLPEERGSVLIFVPGMIQIQRLSELIEKELGKTNLKVLPLHSDIVIDQQNRVFLKADPTFRKVIISTSIAESSITVPDVKYVIDFCLTKELYCDPYTNYTHLRMEWACKSSLQQRRGRAGRVSNGTCYRLIPRSFYDTLDSHTKPAILREPLSQIILNVKRLKQQGEPKRILSMAIQPPKLCDIERNVLLLKEVGALTIKCKNSLNVYTNNPYDGDLTYIGYVMANLPIDVRLTKLILLGHVFGKLREAVIIAAGLSTKTFFTCYYKSYLESFKAKWLWSQGWMCDCLCILNAYNLYESSKKRGLFHNQAEEFKWAQTNMIQLDRIREVEKLIGELNNRLKNMNIRCNREDSYFSSNRGESYNSEKDDLVNQNLILKMIIAGAFYPNYFNSHKVDIQEAYRFVGGKDIYNTVQLKNFPLNEGVLYHQKLVEMFKACSKSVQVHFEDTKAYVEFKSKCDEVASNVNLGVYLACQIRLLRIPLELKRFTPEITHQKLSKLEKLKNSNTNLAITVDSERSGALKLNVLKKKMSKMFDNVFDDDYENEYYDAKTSSEQKSELNESSDGETTDTVVSSDDTLDENHNQKVRRVKKVHKHRNSTNSNHQSVLKEDSTYQSLSNLDKSMEKLSIQKSMSITTLKNNRMSTSGSKSLVEILANPKFVLPQEVKQDHSVTVILSEIVECGHFWVQIKDTSHEDTLRKIHFRLNGNSDSRNVKKYALKLMNPNNISENVLCVTYFNESDLGNQLYRARILSVDKKSMSVEVHFVDFGNKEKKNFTDIFEMSDDLQEYPFQAIECKLVNIKPSKIKNPNGVWTKTANALFTDILSQCDESTFSMKVKYIEDNVAMILLEGQHENIKTDIGEQIILSGFALKVEESELNLNKTRNRYSTQDVYHVPMRQSDYTSNEMTYIQHDYFHHDYSFVASNRSNRSRNDFEDDEDDKSSIAESFDTSKISYLEDEMNQYAGQIQVRGPYSPLEVNYYSIANIGHNRRVRVERDSINYVTLDDEPLNDCNRLMIASDVTLGSNGSTMVLRKTCLMPKIPGLSSICCLLFSSNIELRLDDKCTRYTGALCGLGYDEENKCPLYTDNDIECTFDVNIDLKDITMVCKLTC